MFSTVVENRIRRIVMLRGKVPGSSILMSKAKYPVIQLKNNLMQNVFKIALVAMIIIIASCREERTDLPSEFTVDNYSRVSVDGEFEVVFHQQNSNNSSGKQSSVSSDNFRVKIHATAEQRRRIDIITEDGTLYIRSNDIRMADGVVVELYYDDLAEIRLEGNHVAIFAGIAAHELVVVTAGSSSLQLLNIRVDHLVARTAGNSELTVTTWSENFASRQVFAEDQGVLIGDNLLLVDDTYIYRGNISLADGEWTVEGSDIVSWYRIISTEYNTVGTTMIDAGYAVSETVHINLEGTSEAIVWALDRITGNGTGNSHLYYRPVSGLDLSGFNTQGAAQVSPRPF
jgi:hypothetical protein